MGYLWSQSISSFLGGEYELAIYDMCFGYGDRSAAHYATVDDPHVLIYVRQWCAGHEFDKEGV
jgi:hypothetical protein